MIKILEEFIILIISLIVTGVVELFVILPLLHPCKDTFGYLSLCNITLKTVLPEFLLIFIIVYFSIRVLLRKLKKNTKSIEK